MNFKEIEYKYFANNISLDKFKQTIKDINMKITGITEVKSTDDYFKSTDTKVNFLRYRHNDTYQELTLKKKTNSSNNNNRIEINLKTNSDLETVSAFVEMLGYTHSFTIQKDCYIVHFENGEIVHYTVMDAKEYCEAHREEKKVYDEKYRKAHVEHKRVLDKDYREQHREEKVVMNRAYYIANKANLSEAILCECGATVTKYHLKRHQRSQKHISFSFCK